MRHVPANHDAGDLTTMLRDATTSPSRLEAVSASGRAGLLSRLLRPQAPPLRLGILVAVTVVVAETVTICILKQIAPMNAFGVVYLLGVLIVSTQWGFGLALGTSLGSAIAFDYFRNWPYGPYLPFQVQNEVVVAIFLVVALLANSLAGLARARAMESDHRRREAEESRDELGALARQQAALRRVATLVARGVNPPELFTAVAVEIGRCLDVGETAIVRYESDGTTTTLATYCDPGTREEASSSSDGDRCAAPIVVAG